MTLLMIGPFLNVIVGIEEVWLQEDRPLPDFPIALHSDPIDDTPASPIGKDPKPCFGPCCQILSSVPASPIEAHRTLLALSCTCCWTPLTIYNRPFQFVTFFTTAGPTPRKHTSNTRDKMVVGSVLVTGYVQLTYAAIRET